MHRPFYHEAVLDFRILGKAVTGQRVKWLSKEEGSSRRKPYAPMTINHIKAVKTTVVF